MNAFCVCVCVDLASLSHIRDNKYKLKLIYVFSINDYSLIAVIADLHTFAYGDTSYIK